MEFALALLLTGMRGVIVLSSTTTSTGENGDQEFIRPGLAEARIPYRGVGGVHFCLSVPEQQRPASRRAFTDLRRAPDNFTFLFPPNSNLHFYKTFI